MFTAADVLHFLIVPEGDESDVENLCLSDVEDEANQCSLPLPENVEVLDYPSELDESGTDQDDVQPCPPKKVFQTRSKSLKNQQETARVLKKAPVPKWMEWEHMSAVAPPCDSSYAAPPKKPMTRYQYFSL